MLSRQSSGYFATWQVSIDVVMVIETIDRVLDFIAQGLIFMLNFFFGPNLKSFSCFQSKYFFFLLVSQVNFKWF